MLTVFQNSTQANTPKIWSLLSVTGGTYLIMLLLLSCVRVFAADERTEEEQSFFRTIVDRMRIFATIELEAIYEKDFENKNVNDQEVNFDLEVQLDILAWLWGMVVYARDQSDSELEEAYIALFDTGDRPFYFSVGKMELPFARYDTNMISDPFTLEIAEAFDPAVRLDVEYQDIGASAFAAKGSRFRTDNSALRLFGGSMGYAFETDDLGLSVGAGWINNIYSSDEMSLFLREEELVLKDPVPAFTLHGICEIEPFELMVEYVGAADDPKFIEEDEIEKSKPPRTWNIELGYTFDILEWETTLAIAYQGSRNCLDFLPERRLSGGIIIGITDNVLFSFEYAHDDDHSRSDEGTGEDARTISFQLELEF